MCTTVAAAMNGMRRCSRHVFVIVALALLLMCIANPSEVSAQQQQGAVTGEAAPSQSLQNGSKPVPSMDASACAKMNSLVDMSYNATSVTTMPLAGEHVYQTEWLENKSDNLIFMLTNQGHLLRSTDRGKSFQEIDQLLLNTIPASLTNGSIIDWSVTGGIGFIEKRKEMPNHLWFSAMAIKDHSMFGFSTRDGGKTFNVVMPPKGYESDPTAFAGAKIDFHPTEADWVLAIAYRANCKPTLFKACPKDAFVTHDFGTTWKNLTANGYANGIHSFEKAFWGYTQVHHQRTITGETLDVTKETILAIVRTDAADIHKKIGQWNSLSKFVSSDTEFVTEHKAHLECANAAFHQSGGGTIFVGVDSACDQVVNDDEKNAGVSSGEAALYVSEDLGLSFQKTCYPVDLSHDRYVVEEGGLGDPILLTIFFGENPLNSQGLFIVGTLFVSDVTYKSIFSLSSLQVLSAQGMPEIQEVHGIQGAYIANIIDDSVSESVGGDPTKMSKTMITLNSGGTWSVIPAPAMDSLGKKIPCAAEGKCSLHLYGKGSWINAKNSNNRVPYVYSTPSAPSIIISNGNVGEFADLTNGDLFISRDAGMSFEMIRHGEWQYEIGDGGSIIVIGKAAGLANEIEVSLNEGKCWISVSLPVPIDIHNINIEPGMTSHVFLIHGEDATGTGQVFFFDAQALGMSVPACGTADYEYFTQSKCVSGKRMSMQRKRRDSICFGEIGRAKQAEGCKPPTDNGDPVDDQCRCVCNRVRDVQCDYGFLPEEANGDFACVDIDKVNPKSAGSGSLVPVRVTAADKCPLLKSGQYVVSATGYRLSAGDQCIGPANAGIFDTDGRGRSLIAPAGPFGPHHGGASGFGRFFVAIILLAAVGSMAYFAWTRFAQSDVSAGETISMHAGTVADSISSGIDWFKDKIGMSNGLKRRRLQENFELLAGDEFGLDIGEDERSMASPLA